LLQPAGFRFTVRARPVEEIRDHGESPADYVMRLARQKADASWEHSEDEIILGADTEVVLDDRVLGKTRVLGKPMDELDAREMLRALAGREHIVITGLCLRHAAGAVVVSESTRVWFAAMDHREIGAYAASGEPLDKAGGYAIQGLASKFIERIDGCYFNVMGLPLARFYKEWKKLGY
jgi:septum formation protein